MKEETLTEKQINRRVLYFSAIREFYFIVYAYLSSTDKNIYTYVYLGDDTMAQREEAYV